MRNVKESSWDLVEPRCWVALNIVFVYRAFNSHAKGTVFVLTRRVSTSEDDENKEPQTLYIDSHRFVKDRRQSRIPIEQTL